MSAQQQSLLTNVKPLPSQRGTCPSCGHKLPKVFGHHLSIGLVSVLWKIYYKGGGPIRLVDMDLDHYEFNNAQKLRYFGLMVQADGKRGEWILTSAGRKFLMNEIEIPAIVYTRGAKVVDQSTQTVTVNQVDAGYQRREEFV